MELKNGYKQTEVGVIPGDWEVKELREIAEIKRGKFTPRPRNDPRFYGGDIPFVQTGDVTKSNGRITNFSQTLNEDGLAVSVLFKKGTILMTIAANIGYTGVLQIDMACPDSLVAIDGRKGICNNFLNYNFIYRRQDLEDASTSGAQKNLNIELLKPFKIPLPHTREEQTVIATALSDTDALISRLEALIAKKRAIKQGAMQQLLKPKEGWELKTYGEVFDILSTATYSRAELTTHDEVGYVHYGDIHTQWNFILDVQQAILPSIKDAQVKGYTLIKEGDIIMADASEDYSGIGKSVEVKSLNGKKIIAGLHTFLLRDNKSILVNGFKAYLHVSPFIKKQFDEFATGMKVYGVSKNNLTNVQIPVPPKAEQTCIAQILSDMDAEIAGLEQKLAKYKQVKQGMMQELLTGKTRLV